MRVLYSQYPVKERAGIEPWRSQPVSRSCHTGAEPGEHPGSCPRL